MTRLTALIASLLALLMLPLLAGCDVGGSLVTEVRIGAALRELTTSLEELDGISATYSAPALQGDYTYSFEFTIESDGASVDDIVTAIEMSRDAFAGSLFARQQVNFTTVDAGDAGLVDIQAWIAEAELARELNFWHDLHEATGLPVTLSIHTHPEAPDGYYTGIGIQAFIDDVNVAALRALTSESGAQSVDWVFTGLAASGGLPPAEVVALFARLREIMPVADWNPPGLGIEFQWWQGEADLLVYLARQVVVPMREDPALPQLRALAAAIGDSGLIRTMSVQPAYGSSEGSATIWFWPCSTEYFSSADDDALLALLDTASLPPGTHAGSCAAGE